MLVSGIKSRPVYGRLTLDPYAKRHLIAAEGEGALAVLDCVAGPPADVFGQTTILYASGGSAGQNHLEQLAGLGVDYCHEFPTIPTLLFRLNGMLTTATMGTRLYASGTEGFIGQVIQMGIAHAIDHHSIITEHRGSLARRVQCTHCKGIIENVTTNIATCVHCRVNLLVRDHYSRRLGAFMGVSADAEEAGAMPAREEVFP
jgi:dimethylamine monooxygenase subunit C